MPRRIELTGIRELNRKLRKLEQNVLSVTHRELRHVAEEVAAKARDLAPVDEGFLRSSIEVHSGTDDSYDVIAAAYYAPWVEFGTENMAPQPFMRPAVDSVGQRAVEGVARKVGRTIDIG